MTATLRTPRLAARKTVPGLMRRDFATSWLISFGDLLTLMLCLFLAIISFSSLSPFVVSAKNRLDSASYMRDEAVPRGSFGGAAGGTLLAAPEDLTADVRAAQREVKAEPPPAEIRKTLRLQSEEVTDAGFKQVRNRLMQLMSISGYRLLQASLEVCGEAADEEASWEEAQSRALILRRQLIDTGLESQLLRIAVLGPDCKELGGELEDVAARIEFHLSGRSEQDPQEQHGRR
jgi:hypothetical protein